MLDGDKPGAPKRELISEQSLKIEYPSLKIQWAPKGCVRNDFLSYGSDCIHLCHFNESEQSLEQLHSLKNKNRTALDGCISYYDWSTADHNLMA